MEELKKEPVSAVLLLLNVLIFVIVEITGGNQNIDHMLTCGAAYTPYILESGEVYRLLFCMFLHFGMEHLLNNMLMLFVLGTRLERAVGKVRFFCIYILGGIGGNLLSMFWESKTGEFAVSAGASGAVCALLGAMICVILKNRGRVEDLSLGQILVIAICSLYFGFTSIGVNNAAHIGGILTGLFLAAILYHSGTDEHRFRHRECW